MSVWTRHELEGGQVFLSGRLPDTLMPDDEGFEALWALHPPDFHQIHIHGRLVPTPRWQQAYGADYRYTGQVNRALPVTPMMEPYLRWVREQIDARLNGILFNWYDGALNHYIGAHRDSTHNMVPGSPIVTISFGESRPFRLRPWKKRGYVDFQADHGTVFVLPWDTNLSWTHEVPRMSRHTERRISLTVRAFDDALDATADATA